MESNSKKEKAIFLSLASLLAQALDAGRSRRKGVVRTKLEQRTPVGLVPKPACTERSRSIRSIRASSVPENTMSKNFGAILVQNEFFL